MKKDYLAIAAAAVQLREVMSESEELELAGSLEGQRDTGTVRPSAEGLMAWKSGRGDFGYWPEKSKVRWLARALEILDEIWPE
jgi:hypothetical protein